MKAKIYKLTVTTDVAHRWENKIIEVYIPEVGIAANLGVIFSNAEIESDSERKVNCSYTDGNRYDKDGDTFPKVIDEIDVPDELVDKMQAFLKAKSELSAFSLWFKDNVGKHVEELQPWWMREKPEYVTQKDANDPDTDS